ncbi:MAG: YceD family protein [Gallionella sp.]
MDARHFIDSLDFARNGQSISGEVPVAELPRLQDMLENQQGILGYAIRGGADKQGNHFLDVSVTGLCHVRCQRCLVGIDSPVQIDTRLLLRDQTSLDALGDEEEALDSILADEQLDVLNLLEDEVLLSLPIAPKHDVCLPAGSENGYGEKRHPFAILAKLKQN